MTMYVFCDIAGIHARDIGL